MKMTEMVAAIGDENIQFQNLDQCIKSLDTNKKGTFITFGTDMTFSLNGTDRLGLVLWLDRNRVAEILAKREEGHA